MPLRASYCRDKGRSHRGSTFHVCQMRLGWVPPVRRGRGVRSKANQNLVSLDDPFSTSQPSYADLILTTLQTEIHLHSPVQPSLGPAECDGCRRPWAFCSALNVPLLERP